MVGYDKLNDSNNEQIVHFFLDDYKFEVMWKDPSPRIDRLKAQKAVLSPNFSIYTEMPVAMKIYNTFRSRWCGAFLQANGIKVIPTLAWGGPETFWFCFDGIEQKSVVAVSTVGVRKEKDLFMQGWGEMLRRLKPAKIICYGKPFPEMKGNIIKVDYAKTNNFEKGFIITKYFIEDEYGVKGMGSAGASQPTWANPNTLKDHFDRHAKAFYINDEATYENQAHQFYLNRNKYQTKVDENGTIRVYDSQTNTFGVYNSNGKTITFFKPRHGQRYFDSQPGN